MPRVIAGSAGGRPLKVPAGEGTRPTSDRVKEALFSSLGDLTDLVVADLYAGSGGLGVEALSRGAARAVFVEQDRRAAAIVQHNLAVAGVADRGQVVTAPVATFCRRPVGGPFDIVLLDPPYRMTVPQIDTDLAALIAAHALREGAQVVLERARHDSEPPIGRLDHRRDRTYGDTLLRYFVFRAAHPPALHPPDDRPPTPQGAPPP
ncbi:MAG TPA: 16S rRNA (guanine(966)-N(2))-methyltransferase RsmD [Euzebya sp.]|nr:16S rRNA (guanine(966)-N(2))-methyltransferase RsmD [Euzebya sp.]